MFRGRQHLDYKKETGGAIFHQPCSRCNTIIDGHIGPNFTMGFYDLTIGPWYGFKRPGESVICDNCMFSDPEYIKIYGKVQTQMTEKPTQENANTKPLTAKPLTTSTRWEDREILEVTLGSLFNGNHVGFPAESKVVTSSGKMLYVKYPIELVQTADGVELVLHLLPESFVLVPLKREVTVEGDSK